MAHMSYAIGSRTSAKERVRYHLQDQLFKVYFI